MPNVYNIKWVDEIDHERVQPSEKFIENTKRKKIFYHHEGIENPIELLLATPYGEENNVYVKRMVKNTYKEKETTGYYTTVVFDVTNSSHVEFLTKISHLGNIVSEMTGKELSLPMKENGNVVRLFARIMTDKNDHIYTPFYDDKQVIEDPLSIYGFRGRLAFGFAYNENKLILQVCQAYVQHYDPRFPLLTA